MMYHGPIEASCAAALGVSVEDLAQRLSPLVNFPPSTGHLTSHS